jgi:hypothetical protein
MSCRTFMTSLAPYVESDLPAPGIPTVEEHLAICCDCRELLVDLNATQATLKRLGALEAVHVELLAAVFSGVIRQVRTP